ncbi:MAG: hypothetical protein GT600_09890 [Bacteroidales bacterium]|jgi:hypothetical protein|nr:hypothetical protein [Bacteroidales bacterium]NMD02433.1 hypothetical protein [Bacteroidales bacterium]OQB61343.1 MAG: hypothetical protein BWX96_01812 [Bacteroidetes bacterium ADurb.Bin145]
MKSERVSQYLTLLAKVVSLLFHPLLMPLYGLLVIFYAPTILAYLPSAVKKILFLIILINNVFVPLSLMPYFRYRNIITSWAIGERKERILPLIVTSVLYSVTAYVIYRFKIPGFIKSYILVSAFLVIAVTILNFWWKVSIHSTAAGAVTALIAILSIMMQADLRGLLVMAILITGIIMSARLYLNSHKPAEVWTGLFIGMAGSGLTLLIL